MEHKTLLGVRYFVWALNRSHQMTLAELKKHLEINRSRVILIFHNIIDTNGTVRKMSVSEYQCLPHENPLVRVTSEQEHPEQKETQVHVGNCRRYERKYIEHPGLKTVCEGKVAYSETGKILPREFFPVFVDSEEIFPGSSISLPDRIAA